MEISFNNSCVKGGSNGNRNKGIYVSRMFLLIVNFW